MPITRVNAVLYLTKTFFDFYAIGMANTLRYTFPANTIQHLDVVTPESLSQQIQAFTQTNKLPSANILMLLSDDLLFCKELPLNAGVNPTQENEMNTFLDAVPFDQVLSKLYKLEKKEILVATNSDFFTRFQTAFKSNNSRINEVVPVFLLGKTVNLQSGMPQDIAHIILDKLGNIKPWSMPLHDIAQVQASTSEEKSFDQSDSNVSLPPTPPKKRVSKKVVILGTSMVPLLGIFLFMFMQMNAENAKEEALFRAKQQTTQLAQTKPTPVPTVIVAAATDQSTSAFTATIDEQNLKVSIEYSAASASIAANMRTELTNFGIKSIQDIQETTGNTTNTVVFAKDLPDGTKQRILDELHKVVAEVDIQDNEQMSDDVLITLP